MAVIANLVSNQTLPSKTPLISPNGLYRAIVEADGNFRLFKYPFSGSRQQLWGMGSNLVPDSHIFMNPGGRIELCGPDGHVKAFRGCIPQSNTSACVHKLDPFLAMQDDGNLVVYNRTDNLRLAIFATDTQEDGEARRNLVIPGALVLELPDGSIDGNANRIIDNQTASRAVVIAGNQTVILEPSGKVAVFAPGTVAIEASWAGEKDQDGSQDALPTNKVTVEYSAATETFIVKNNGANLSLT